ncbi:MAG: hydroxylamine reductase [bacterium]
MFCFQCEQTAQGSGCTVAGVCGKSPEAAFLQDALLYAVKGISMYAARAGKAGMRNRETDVFVIEALFSTITNVNFDPEALRGRIITAGQMKEKARLLYEEALKKEGRTPEALPEPASWIVPQTMEELLEKGKAVNAATRFPALGEAIAGLQEMVLYGLKGMAAYADHAQILGVEDEGVYLFFHQALSRLAENPSSADELLGLALRVGEMNIRVMELLDRANTGAYGAPVPTAVRITPRSGKAILVSGHDLKDLEELLKQTEGRGINVYTHGEMLPAHGYPALKKYSHLAGNYGSAWQNQREEFDRFPGSILMTTNCIQKPKNSYMGRIFTCGLVRYPGVTHIENRNFKQVIEAALQAEGFPQDEAEKTILVGFGHGAVLGVADKVVEAVKSGAIRHFFLIGGCDGAKPGRNYYTEFAQMVPKDSVILTLACGKYRFNTMDFGTIGGLPRLLDIGQCNDAYSAIKIASALAGVFHTDVNGLPLSLILSWYEQKAVVILLSLLSLGIKNIRLGPSLPAFIKPAVYEILREKFNIMPISTPKEDLEAILNPSAA